MVSTVHTDDQRVLGTEAPRTTSTVLVAVIVVLALVCLGLGALLVVADGDDDARSSVPSDVQAVLDEFEIAMETYDYDLLQRIVTDGYRRPSYEGDPFGGPAYRAVQDIGYFDFFEDEEPIFEVERIGEPIVHGDGPWYVSYAETWPYPAQGLEYVSVYTYVIVDVDGEKLIDDAYWAGHSVVAEDDS